MVEGPTERKLKEMFGIAVGEASMCWNPRPSHEVFDSAQASVIVDRLTCDVLQLFAEVLDKNAPRTRNAEQACPECSTDTHDVIHTDLACSEAQDITSEGDKNG